MVSVCSIDSTVFFIHKLGNNELRKSQKSRVFITKILPCRGRVLRALFRCVGAMILSFAQQRRDTLSLVDNIFVVRDSVITFGQNHNQKNNNFSCVYNCRSMLVWS